MKKKSYTVAVTGFGVRAHPSLRLQVEETNAGQRYREYDYNNSITIRDGIPSTIVRKGKPPINIVKYPHDINCIYFELLDLAPELWSVKRSVYEPKCKSTKMLEINLMIHTGMHPDEDDYILEKRARREKYEHPGDDGKYLKSRCIERPAGEAIGGIQCRGCRCEGQTVDACKRVPSCASK